MISFKTDQREEFALVTFEIEGGVCAPSDLLSLTIPEGLDMRKGLVLGGRGPVWLYCHLTHLAHPFAWVATQDPRLGAVVVQRHTTDAPELGAVIPL